MKTTIVKKSQRSYITAALLSLFSSAINAQITPALVDFDAYESLVAEVKEHRKTRMLNAEEFAQTSKEEKVIILDTRSDSMYAAVHVKGAVHLNFSDFTQVNLAKIIPSNDYKVLIYCNNNFSSTPLALNTLSVRNFEPYFATKVSMPREYPQLFIDPKAKIKAKSKSKIKSGPNNSIRLTEPELTEIIKPVTLALNIPTYINLYGYGYRNVYELSELVNTYDNKLEFEGTAVK